MSRIPVNQPYRTDKSIPFGDPDPKARFGKHAGIDYAVGTGSYVYAPASGTVTSYVSGVFHGNVVEIFTGKDYPHMLHNSILLVKPGDKVVEGQVVARSGSTGQGVTGPHVHFGVGKKSLPATTSFNDFIDPNEWVKGDSMAELTQGQLDKLIKGMLGREPNATELNDTNWMNDAGLAVDTLWEHGGKQRFAEDQNPPEYVKTEVYIRKG